MFDVLASASAALVSLIGFGLLALAQERHWNNVTGLDECCRIPAASLRFAGLAAQALACVLFVVAEGPSFGALLWGVGMTGTAMAIAFALTWKPQALCPLASALRLRLKAFTK